MTEGEAARELLGFSRMTKEHGLCPGCEVRHYDPTGEQREPPEGFREAVHFAAFYKPCQPDDPKGYAWIERVPPAAYKAFIDSRPGAFMLDDLRKLLPPGA